MTPADSARTTATETPTQADAVVDASIIRAREIARHVKLAGWDWFGGVDDQMATERPVICIYAPKEAVRAFVQTVLDDDVIIDNMAARATGAA